MFFLISGFLIAMSYEKNKNIANYAKNRILRIFPALYVNIFIGVLILYIFGYIEFNTQFFTWLFAQATIIQFYNAEMFREFGVGVINGSLWTISVELTFYILLPFLFFFLERKKFLLILIFLLSFVVFNYDLNSNKEIFYNKFLHIFIAPYLFIFIIGIYFYKYFEILKKYLVDKILLWFFVFIVYNLIVKYFEINESNYLISTIKWLIFSFFIFSFVFSFRNLSYKIFKGNDYTYGIYIYHMLIINVMVYLNYVAQIKYIIITIVLSIFSGILSWHIIEKPFLKLKKNSLFNNRIKL